MNCPTCQEKLFPMTGFAGAIMSTLVGYYSPSGHDHDDNCVKRGYTCAKGHDIIISKQNACDAEGCTWKGKETCFCHPGQKVEEWP
jgi:hypothetical protein